MYLLHNEEIIMKRGSKSYKKGNKSRYLGQLDLLDSTFKWNFMACPGKNIIAHLNKP